MTKNQIIKDLKIQFNLLQELQKKNENILQYLPVSTTNIIRKAKIILQTKESILIGNDSTTLNFSKDILEQIEKHLENDKRNPPFVEGDLEIRITITFPLKEILVYDDNGQQIASSTTKYLEIFEKTNCVPAGKKYTIKIIGQSDKDIITKLIEKKEKGDLVIYVQPSFSSVFDKYKKLVGEKKYKEATKLIIESYGLDKNQCPSYNLKITNDAWSGLTTEGEICGEQTVNIRTGFLKVGIKNEANFAQIVSCIGHEFVHIRQKGDLGMLHHNEREFLAYYWEVFQQGVPTLPFRRKFAAEKALNDYVKRFDANQKEKYKEHIKRIKGEYSKKYKK